MVDQLTSTGLEIDSFEDRLATVLAGLRTAISATLDASPDQPSGQLIRIPLEHLQQVAELLEAVHTGMDPDLATGLSLEAICALTGTMKRAATHGHATLTVNLDGGTTLLAGSIAGAGTDAENRWETDVDVVAPAGPAAAYAVLATCITAGAIVAPARTITTIVTPVAGWNTVTNAADATAGLEEETDAELRVRRELEVSQGGSTSARAILAAVLEIEEVLEAFVFENDSDVSVDGMPPHSIEVCYWDGTGAGVDQAELAAVILESKAGGIEAFGGDSETVVDDAGSHQVGFTRATERAVGLQFTLITDDDYPGNAAFSAAMAALALEQLGVGDDIVVSKWIANAMTFPGVVDMAAPETQWMATPGYAITNRVVGSRQIATIAAGDVVVL